MFSLEEARIIKDNLVPICVNQSYKSFGLIEQLLIIPSDKKNEDLEYYKQMYKNTRDSEFIEANINSYSIFGMVFYYLGIYKEERVGEYTIVNLKEIIKSFPEDYKVRHTASIPDILLEE